MDYKKELEIARKRLGIYYECETKILEGAQSYKIGNRNLTRANLKEIQDMILTLTKRIAELESLCGGSGSRKVYGVIPCDF